MPRLVCHSRIEAAQSDNKQFLVLVSYLEIYQEVAAPAPTPFQLPLTPPSPPHMQVINDLLNPSDKTLKIREHPKQGIFVVPSQHTTTTTL